MSGAEHSCGVPGMKFRRLLIPGIAAALLALAGCGPQNPDGLVASAKGYIAKSDEKAAIVQLKSALQKDPDHAEARLLLGQMLLATGDPNGASVELRRALDLGQPAGVVVPVLARAMVAEGRYKELLDQYAALDLPQAAASADLRTSISLAYSGIGKKQEADAALAAALKAVPGYVPALQFDTALQMVDKILQSHPDQATAWQLKGDLQYLGKGDGAAAVTAYRKALAIKQDLLPSHTGIITIALGNNDLNAAKAQLEELKKFFPNQAQTKYFEALLALRQHDLVNARQLAQQLLRGAPNYSRALHLAGAVEYEMGSLSQAEKYLSQTLQQAPGHRAARRLLAQTYLRSGQPAKALNTLLPAVEARVPDPDLFPLVAEAYLQNGDMKKAAEYFTRATKADPNDVRSRTALALTHLADSNADAAFSELQDIAAADSGTTADLALISVRFDSKDLNGALKAVDALERKQPDKPLAPSLRGRIQLSRMDVDGARKSFERAVALDPAYFPAVDSLAAIDLAQGKIKDATARFEKLLSLQPSNDKALLAIAGLRSLAGGSKEEVADLINKAIKAGPSEIGPRLVLMQHYVKHKDIKAALVAGQNAVAAMPDNAQLVEALGNVQVISGDDNQAISSYTKLATLLPQSPRPYLLLADVYVKSKNSDMAVQSLKRALAIAPDSLQAQRNLVALELAGGRSQEALALAQSVQKQRSNEGIGYLFEGDVEAALKNFDGAANAYRAGLKKRKSTDLAIKLHSVLLTAGRKAEAEKFASGWLTEFPKDADFRFHLGDLALSQGDYAQAESNYLGVIQLRPDNAAALNNLAWLTSKLKKKNALAYAEKANSIAPGQPVFMDTLATLQKKAIEIQTNNPALRLTLAKIYVMAGDKGRARDELLQLSKIGPQFAGHEEVSQLLKSL
ncbi:MAG: PEP-CTERM system TPR-repeat protein PrsT [Betaproteobacteria bacterium]|nr:MAG: PEP-CTERM system TPR-repeat protein PrsT [Betaproteobacteria bacterium]